MLVATRTVTINAAFLQEIKEDNAELRALLAVVRSKMCEAPPPARIRPRRFAVLLAELRDQLAMYFALEEAYGYFDEPVSVEPSLSEQAESVRNQHSELYEEISRLAESAEDILSGNGHLRGLRQLARQFLDFHRQLEDHEARESELAVQVMEGAPVLTSNVVTDQDRQRLGNLVDEVRRRGVASPKLLMCLEEKLEFAECVLRADVPDDVVTMNSKFRLRDLETNQLQTFVLCYPDAVGRRKGDLSVLDTIGFAVLGCRVGDEIVAKDPNGVRRVQLVEVFC